MYDLFCALEGAVKGLGRGERVVRGLLYGLLAEYRQSTGRVAELCIA